MSKKPLIAFALPLFVALSGCHHTHEGSSESQMDTPSGGRTQHEAANVDDYVQEVLKARTPAAEADALRRLHRYESDHGLTYTTQIVRTYDNVPIASASVGNQPVRANVIIQRGREVVRTFSFVPQDNRNLALLGE